ncbi:MAG TPA: PVC-type heme-binding CxxCH protein [Candidatus Limnocylindria bacterium]|nr:PVC-type heme-binding CxxCH protein [Candidatus Limnocylindria bacterium]
MNNSRAIFLAAALTSLPALAAEFTVDGRKFTLPDGFTVTRVTTTNLVQRPVSAAFDNQGRLYVTDSDGSSAAPAEQLKHPGSRIVRLEDTDGDGVFDKTVVFADKVMFPQGCLWHDGWVYAASPPSIWRYRDTDGDGVADQREEWFKGGTLTGCANDIHGPYLGPDGYIYWTKGAFSEQTHTLGNGRVLKDKAAHIYRSKPDGSDLDVIMTGGMDNPVEIAFTPEGEVIFSSTFIDFSQPGFRDGIGHAVYGGVFGKQSDVIEDVRVKRTGPEVFHPFYEAGPAAECGLTRYESDVFGPGYRDNLFATTFNLHKVTRHILRPSGATYASTDSDFLATDDVDFHPTDVLPDADGSLLVVDTGGWYRLCCPSSQLAKPDVLGAIYRVIKNGTPKLAPTDRDAAYARVIKPSLAQGILTVSLKQAAQRRDAAAAERMLDALAGPGIKAALTAEPIQLVRVAAEGLGRLRDKRAVEPLLRAIGLNDDAFLQHSLIYALIEIADPADTRVGLRKGSTKVQRAALIALSEMNGSDLKPTEVTPFLSATDEPLRTTASWILGRHPEWAGELAGWFREQLTATNAVAAQLEPLNARLPILAHATAGQELLAEAITKPAFRPATRVAALGVIANADLENPPASWRNAVLTALSPPSREVAAAIHAARSLNADPAIAAALLAAGRDPVQPADLRLSALAALPAGAALAGPEFDFLRPRLAAANAPVTRTTAADVLSHAKLDATQLATLTEDLKAAGPLELNRLLTAFDGGGDDVLGQKLVAALREAKGAKALNAGQLRTHLAKFPDATQQAGDRFLATLDTSAPKQAAHLDALLADFAKLTTDVRRGQALFNGPKAACATCHRIGYVGGNVGPELTKIGDVRSERDLLESVVYPSASFVRNFEPTIVTLQDGDQVNGILKRETPEEIVLVTGAGPEQHLRRSEITETRPGTLSIMPGGFDEQLSRQELADLLFFVKTVRWR